MTRRPWTALVLLLLTACLPALARGESPRPNIIYLLLDDAGYGDLSCYGQTRFQTPNVDALAREGMKFTQHYAGSTVCAPTRCSLMTGLHTGHAQVRGNREVKPEGQSPLKAGTTTVAGLLKDAGYRTGAFGKWGLGFPGSEGDPVNQGFDVFYGYNCQREAHTYYPKWLWDNLEKVELDGETYAHDLIVERALRFIRESREGPFFCFLPWTIPHAAMHVPESYAAPFREKFPQFEDVIGKYKGPHVKNPVAAFAGMMVKMDEDVGRVSQLLKELEIDENTIFLFTSDNGPHREGGHRPGFFDSNGPLRGHKRDLTEGGIRVPLLVRWPGKIRPGTVSEHVSAHWDFLPTACELAGIETPDGLDGLSFVPELLGKEQAEHAHLYWEFYEQGGKRAARFGRWKAIQTDLRRRHDPPVELYDLGADPGETVDLASLHPEKVKRAREIFAREHVPSEDWGKLVDPEAEKRRKQARQRRKNSGSE